MCSLPVWTSFADDALRESELFLLLCCSLLVHSDMILQTPEGGINAVPPPHSKNLNQLLIQLKKKQKNNLFFEFSRKQR